MTLAEYVDFPFKSAQFGSINNRQVSLLAGEEHAHERGEFQLRFALRSLQLFDFVGLTEDFGASMRLLAHTLARRLGHSEQVAELGRAGGTHLNGGGARAGHGAELSAPLRRKLEKKNALDQQLYDLAKADFYRRLCAEGEGEAQRVGRQELRLHHRGGRHG